MNKEEILRKLREIKVTFCPYADEGKNTLLVIGGLDLLAWLWSRKKKGKCPRCGYPVTEENAVCPNCRQHLNWGDFK